MMISVTIVKRTLLSTPTFKKWYLAGDHFSLNLLQSIKIFLPFLLIPFPYSLCVFLLLDGTLYTSFHLVLVSHASRIGHHYSLFSYPPHWVILSSVMHFHNSITYIHPESIVTAIIHTTYLWACMLHYLLSLSTIYHISHHHHPYSPFCDLRSPIL